MRAEGITRLRSLSEQQSGVLLLSAPLVVSYVDEGSNYQDLSVSAPRFSSLLLSADIEKRMEDLGFFNAKVGPMTNARYMLRMVADVRVACPQTPKSTDPAHWIPWTPDPKTSLVYPIVKT